MFRGLGQKLKIRLQMKGQTENKILCQEKKRKVEKKKLVIMKAKLFFLVCCCCCCTFVTTFVVFFVTRSVSDCFGFVSVLGVGFLLGLPVVGKMPDEDSSSVVTSD